MTAIAERVNSGRESACCPCRGLLCDPDCACPECPHREEDLTDA